MKMRLYILSGLAAAGWLVTATLAVPPKPRNGTSDVMKFKMHHAQRVLEGITTENFEVLSDSARKLKNLGGQADWQVRATPEYQRLTADFVRTADALHNAAARGNVDAATVAYFQMIVSCTTCHRYLRGERGVGQIRSGMEANSVATLQSDLPGAGAR